MTYVPIIDQSSCIAQGDCVELAPEVFQLDDFAEVVGPGPDESILAAARMCPVEAISVFDSESGAQVFP